MDSHQGTNVTTNETIIYQTVNINVLNYNVFSNQALSPYITTKQRQQIDNVTSILAKDGIDGTQMSTKFIQTKFKTLEELEEIINECNIKILQDGVNIEYEAYDAAEKLYVKETSNNKDIKKAEKKLNIALDKCLESAIHYVFRKIVLPHNVADRSVTSESLAKFPPIFVNASGEVEAWISEGMNVRSWLTMHPQNTWAKVGHCIANRITQATRKRFPELYSRYTKQKSAGVPFSKTLIRKLRKDLQGVWKTDTANGWHQMTKRCGTSDRQITEMSNEAITEAEQVT